MLKKSTEKGNIKLLILDLLNLNGRGMSLIKKSYAGIL